MSGDNPLISSAARYQAPPVQDRKVARINAAAEQRRQDSAAAEELRAQRAAAALEERRAKLELKREQKALKAQEKDECRAARRQVRAKAAAKVRTAVPVVGRRVMIAGPILAPMAVAWIGQIGFALNILHWIPAGAVVFAASWELTTMFCGWMYHEARKAGDHGTLFRIATWMSASGAAAMNYWHNCPVVHGHIKLAPTPKAVAYGAMSLVGIALWELYCALVHRKALRERGVIPPARPRFGVARWLRYTRVTWWAWSLTIRHGYTTTEQAWAAAVAEVARRDRLRAARKAAVKRAKARKKNAKAGRLPVRVTAIWHRGPKVTRRFGLTAWTAQPVVWLPIKNQLPVVAQSQSGSDERSEIASPTRSESGPETRTVEQSETGPKKRTRSKVRTGKRSGSRGRTKSGPKARTGTDLEDLLERARELDSAHLQDRGRHISADNLRAALRIGKPAALDLVKQVRGGHIDIAK